MVGLPVCAYYVRVRWVLISFLSLEGEIERQILE